MLRAFCLFFVLLAVLLGEPTSLSAQQGVEAPPENADWPAYPMPGPHKISRGPGGYLSPVKLFLCWLVFLAWVASCDWAHRDASKHRLKATVWNSVTVFPFLATFFLLTLTFPVFFFGYLFLVISFVVPMGVYIWQRNQKVEMHQRVLTPGHLRHFVAGRAKKVGVQMESEKRADHQRGAKVQITPQGGADEREDQANLILARQSPGFVYVKDLLADSAERRAVKVLLDRTAETVATQYQIDGVWHQVESYDLESGELLLAVLKKLCNLDMEERRERQAGRFSSTYKGHKYNCELVTQGTKTGERAILQISGLEVKFESLADLGMREQVSERLKELLAEEKGMLLVSAMPGNGLTTTMVVAMRSTDRFMRDFLEVADAEAEEPEVDNIEMHYFKSQERETPDTILPSVLRRDPNVLIVRDLPNANTVKLLCKASKSCLVISTVWAKEAVEALLKVLMVKAPAPQFASAVKAVLCQRLIRRLCSECKEAYAPPKELLAKLGLPEGRVKAFYRPPQGEAQKRHENCPQCSGIGYHGQTAIFQLLEIDDRLREALVKQPSPEVLRNVARAAGNRTMQGEGILLVARGITSLAELQRVLKQ